MHTCAHATLRAPPRAQGTKSRLATMEEEPKPETRLEAIVRDFIEENPDGEDNELLNDFMRNLFVLPDWYLEQLVELSAKDTIRSILGRFDLKIVDSEKKPDSLVVSHRLDDSGNHP